MLQIIIFIVICLRIYISCVHITYIITLLLQFSFLYYYENILNYNYQSWIQNKEKKVEKKHKLDSVTATNTIYPIFHKNGYDFQDTQ